MKCVYNGFFSNQYFFTMNSPEKSKSALAYFVCSSTDVEKGKTEILAGLEIWGTQTVNEWYIDREDHPRAALKLLLRNLKKINDGVIITQRLSDLGWSTKSLIRHLSLIFESGYTVIATDQGTEYDSNLLPFIREICTGEFIYKSARIKAGQKKWQSNGYSLKPG